MKSLFFVLSLSICANFFTANAAVEDEFSSEIGGIKFDTLRVNKEKLAEFNERMDQQIKSMNRFAGDQVEALTSDNQLQADESSPVYSQIYGYLKDTYKVIGAEKSGNILNYRKTFDLGDKNYRGFTWQKPFGAFRIYVNRDLSPDLFSDKRYVVSDTFVVEIDALTLLHDLENSDVIDHIDQSKISAFAGMKFKRSYNYRHYAPNFEAGLTSGFEKLFLSFLKFSDTKFLVEKDEYIKRDDEIGYKVGGTLHIPTQYGIGIDAGVLVQKSKLMNVGIMGVQSDKVAVRISVSKQVNKSIDVTAKLTYDFFKLLKITLLSTDVNYTFEDKMQYDLSLSKDQINDINQAPDEQKALSDTLRSGAAPTAAIQKYVTSKQHTQNESRSVEVDSFFRGASLKKSTAITDIEKGERIKQFFTHTDARMTFENSLWAQIVNNISRAIANVDLMKKYRAYHYEDAVLEYSNEKGLMTKDSNVVWPQISLQFNEEYFAKSTKGKANKRIRQRASSFAKNYMNLDSEVFNSLANGQISGEITLNSHGVISAKGIQSMSDASKSEITSKVSAICRGSSKCVKKLSSKWLDFVNKKNQDFITSLKSLREFVDQLLFYYSGKSDLRLIFGNEEVFIYGSLSAPNNDIEFTNYFSDGVFKGLNAIDQYKREASLPYEIPVQN